VFCFGNEGQQIGPHPISKEDLRAAFEPAIGWEVVAIESAQLQTRFSREGTPAWFATIKST
jgi:hypothetical protein